MENLSRKPFSDFENKKEYKIDTFTEQGIDVRILNEAKPRTKIPSGNNYKFGVIDNGQYFWLFEGKVMIHGRPEMLDVFKELTKNYQDTELLPFVYKVKRA